jgi:hypothetical protein
LGLQDGVKPLPEVCQLVLVAVEDAVVVGTVGLRPESKKDLLFLAEVTCRIVEAKK